MHNENVLHISHGILLDHKEKNENFRKMDRTGHLYYYIMLYIIQDLYDSLPKLIKIYVATLMTVSLRKYDGKDGLSSYTQR